MTFTTTSCRTRCAARRASSIFTGNFPTTPGSSPTPAPTAASTPSTPAATSSDVQRGAAERRLPDRDDGQVPQRLPAGADAIPAADTYVPPGWNEWDVAGYGYPEFNYPLNQNGDVHHYGHRADGLSDRRDRPQGRALHQPLGRGRHSRSSWSWPPSRRTPRTRRPRATRTLPGPDGAAAAELRRAADQPAAWLAGHPPLPNAADRSDQPRLPLRVQSVQAVDDMIARSSRRCGPRAAAQHLHRVQLRQRLPHRRVPAVRAS